MHGLSESTSYPADAVAVQGWLGNLAPARSNCVWTWQELCPSSGGTLTCRSFPGEEYKCRVDERREATGLLSRGSELVLGV